MENFWESLFESIFYFSYSLIEDKTTPLNLFANLFNPKPMRAMPAAPKVNGKATALKTPAAVAPTTPASAAITLTPTTPAAAPT